ncbi:MAG: capsular biosynthesis protein [Thermoanaerobaculia bacterium]|nr:capsular biosynthesis protein [Thermoanaerobaculia bacterium]
MIDLHSHILPGVDDGAEDLDEALEICRLAYEDGVRAMVATPHLRQESFWNDDRNLLVDRFKALRAAVRRTFEGEFEIHLGGEIAVHGASLEEINQLPGGNLLTLAGTSYLLLELDWHGVGPDPHEMIHEVVVAGFRPIIAHPERVAWFVRDRELVESLVDQGAMMQLTAMSVTGELGRRTQETSEWMLDAGLVHFLASDAHDPSLRHPGLKNARQVVAERWGEPLAQALVEDHPQAVLEDRPIDARAVPIEREAKAGLWSGFARRLLSGEED